LIVGVTARRLAVRGSEVPPKRAFEPIAVFAGELEVKGCRAATRLPVWGCGAGELVLGAGAGVLVLGAGLGVVVLGAGAGVEVLGAGVGTEVEGEGVGTEVEGEGVGAGELGLGFGRRGSGQRGADIVWRGRGVEVAAAEVLPERAALVPETVVGAVRCQERERLTLSARTASARPEGISRPSEATEHPASAAATIAAPTQRCVVLVSRVKRFTCRSPRSLS